MRIRPIGLRRLWRPIPVLVLLCLWAPRLTAQVPDTLIQRVVDLNVQTSELQFERDSHQIDTDTWANRNRPVSEELRQLRRQLGSYSPDEQRQANSQIDGLTRTRLATLQPQWQAKITQSRVDERKRSDNLAASVTADARAALAPQRRRLDLQARRDRGDITPAEFAAQDKQALDEIMALRNKHVADGGDALQRFDSELRRLTAAAAAAPPAAPKPRVQAPPRAPAPSVQTTSAPTPVQEPWTLSGILSIVLGVGVWVVIIAVIVWLVKRGRAEEKPAGRQVSTVHGTAHYAPLRIDMPNERHVDNGIFLGKSSDTSTVRGPLETAGAPVCSTPEHHTLIVARTRTGKGTRVIIPTLLKYQGSAVVIDPKGENAAITALVRDQRLNQQVHILNPWNELADYEYLSIMGVATYNPLDVLDRNDPNVVAIAQTMAATICPAPAGGKDKFWQGSAANMLTAVLLWLTEYEPEHKTLGRAREIVSLTRKDLRDKFLIPMAASEAFSGAIKEMAAPFIDLAQETYSGVMSNLSEATRFLSDPQIKAATAKSSFSMADLAKKKTTVYVVIPTERMDTQKTWLRLVIASAMQSVKRVRASERAGHRCLFLIDEFAALGRMEELPRDIATMSGFGMDFALVVQGLDQLKDHYHEAAATILSNCAYKWFCNVGDLESAKYLSETLGKATVETVSTSQSFTAPKGDGSGGGSTSSTSRGETGRSLLNPDEVLNLGKDVAIALQPQGHPHLLRTIDYWNLPTAFVSLSHIYPFLYWNPPLTYGENPYVSQQATPAPVAQGAQVFVPADR